MTESLSGRAALVTGSGRGIGRAIAVALASAGARVALVARDRAQLEATRQLIEDAGGTAHPIVADLGALASVPAVVDEVAAVFGAVDVLINNAATVAPLAHTSQLAASDVEAALRLNVAAPILLAGAVIDGMRDRGWGRIVNLSSGVAARPSAMVGATVYASTKGAIEAHTLNLAAELDGTGVTVNAYRPGMVDTGMQESIRGADPRDAGERLVRGFTRAHEEGRLLTAEHSARVLLAHLLSDGGTGSVWDVAQPPVAPSPARSE